MPRPPGAAGPPLPGGPRLRLLSRSTRSRAGASPTGPAPSAANLGELAAHTRSCGADLGAGLNVDGDRLGLRDRRRAARPVRGGGPAAGGHGPAAPPARPGGHQPVHLQHGRGGRPRRRAAGPAQPGRREPRSSTRGWPKTPCWRARATAAVAVLPTSMTFDALLTLGLVLEEMAVDLGLAGRAGRSPAPAAPAQAGAALPARTWSTASSRASAPATPGRAPTAATGCGWPSPTAGCTCAPRTPSRCSA